MDWESFWNIVDYHVRERHLSHWRRALAHHRQAGCLAVHGLMSRRWIALPRVRKETPPMDAAVAPISPPRDLPVLGRAILTRMDQDARQAIAAAIRAEVAAEVHAAAVEEAREALESEYEARRVRQDDRLARERQQLEDECELRIEGAIQAGLETRKAELENTILDLREERDAARAAQDAISDWLLGLLRQLLGTEARKTALYSRGIREFDQHRANVILRPFGLRVRSEAVVGSERQVHTLVTADTTQDRVLFWIEAVPKGAADADAPLSHGIPAKYVVRP